MGKDFYCQTTLGEIHDTTETWVNNSEANYVKCIQDLISSRPFGNHKFYILSFIKRVNDLLGVKKMYHQPRLTKPYPVPGTTLLRVDPSDPSTMTIFWTLPTEEAFDLYKQGKIFSDETVHNSIHMFLRDPKSMCEPESDDLTDDEIRKIYMEKAGK